MKRQKRTDRLMKLKNKIKNYASPHLRIQMKRQELILHFSWITSLFRDSFRKLIIDRGNLLHQGNLLSWLLVQMSKSLLAMSLKTRIFYDPPSRWQWRQLHLQQQLKRQNIVILNPKQYAFNLVKEVTHLTRL